MTTASVTDGTTAKRDPWWWSVRGGLPVALCMIAFILVDGSISTLLLVDAYGMSHTPWRIGSAVVAGKSVTSDGSRLLDLSVGGCRAVVPASVAIYDATPAGGTMSLRFRIYAGSVELPSFVDGDGASGGVQEVVCDSSGDVR